MIMLVSSVVGNLLFLCVFYHNSRNEAKRYWYQVIVAVVVLIISIKLGFYIHYTQFLCHLNHTMTRIWESLEQGLGKTSSARIRDKDEIYMIVMLREMQKANALSLTLQRGTRTL